MSQILTVQRSFLMAGSHFRALASLNEGAKTLRAAILGHFRASGGHFGRRTADCRLRFAKIGKRNAYRSSQSELSPIQKTLSDRISDPKKRIAMRFRRYVVHSLSEAPL